VIRSDHRWRAVDGWIIAALLVAAFAATRWYLPRFRADGGHEEFYQAEFGPAVMQACGRGFVNPVESTVPALDAFLHGGADRFSCDALPVAMRTRALNPLQGVTRYLMTLVGAVWRAVGVRWAAVDIVTAAFVAASVAAAYAALSLATGPWIALATTAWWMWSPRHLQNIPHLRDYSKTPFFMAMLVGIVIACVETRPRWLLAAGVAFGAVTGFGFGMRTDVLLNFGPFLLVLFAVASRADLKPRIVAAVAALAVFAAVSYPVMRTYARSSSLWHVVLLGFTSPYEENLNIGFPRPAYSFPYAHNDAYIEAVVRSFWSRLRPADPPLAIVTRPYDRACQEYFERIARTFPGDIVTRAIASANLVANLPSWLPIGQEVPIGITSPRLVAAWMARASFMRRFDGAWLWLVIAAIVAVGTISLWYAVVSFGLFWFWAGVPAVEFQGRHIYQFEFLMLAVFAVCGAWCVALLARFAQGADIGAFTRRTALSLALVAALIVAVVATVTAGRLIQEPRVRALIDGYIAAPTAAVQSQVVTLPNDQARLSIDLFTPPIGRDDVQEAVVKADLDFDRCGRSTPVTATFRYIDTDPRLAVDFSRTTTLDYPGRAGTHVFLPVYLLERDGVVVSRFVGVDVPASFADCVRLSRVRDPGSLAMIVPVTVEPDWSRKLYERVRFGKGLGY